uniref:Uncharacterized protein n=1 Tax=Anguilla anguilla TaxID=7936 RepID=A0A0E9UW73_ANGAN
MICLSEIRSAAMLVLWLCEAFLGEREMMIALRVIAAGCAAPLRVIYPQARSAS